MPEAFPKTASDAVHFTNACVSVPTVTLPSKDENGGTKLMSLAVGSVSGLWNYTLSMRDTEGDNSAWNARTLTVGSVNGFDGVWTSGSVLWNLTFDGSTAANALSRLNTTKSVNVTVPEGASVSVADLAGNSGRLVKSGTGSLTVKAVTSPDGQTLYAKAGELVLAGEDPSVTAPPVGDPLFWVDASDTNRMRLAVLADGRTHVTNLLDVREGRAIFAKTTAEAGCSTPFLVTNATSGRLVLDFGSTKNRADADVRGAAAGLYYALGKNVRDIVLVVRDVYASSDVFYVGQMSPNYACNFHRGYGGSAGQLFDSAASATVREGRLFLDGVGVTSSTTPSTNRLHVLEYEMHGDGLLPNTFANDRGNIRYGGMELAEALFYTNRLTHAERAAVTHYLGRKWKIPELATPVEASALWASDSARVSVPAGRTATVRQAVLTGKTFVKDGPGTLRVGRFQPENAKLEIRGGAVEIDDGCRVAEDAPAANPSVWLDATVRGSLVTTNALDGTTEMLTRWNDRRGAGYPYGTLATRERDPILVEGACNGLRVIDFGDWSAGANAAKKTWGSMAFSPRLWACEGFALVRVESTSSSGMNIFGCNGQDLLRQTPSALVHGGFAYLDAVAGIWTMNGLTVDPRESFAVNGSTYYVASFAAQSSPEMLIASDRITCSNGGQRIGELILYGRHLTDAERRGTIAYLMKKWRNETYAFARDAAALDSVAFTADNPEPVLQAAVDTSIRSVSSATSTLTKRGVAEAKVVSELSTDITDFKVEQGTLDVSCGISLSAGAAFHVDASRSDTIAFRAGQEADGRIDRWYDCRGNGMYAATPMVAPGKSYGGLTNALYRTSDGTLGLTKDLPYVDFLSLVAGSSTVNEGSGMFWYNADGSQFHPYDLREWHLVFKFTAGGNCAPIGGTQGTAANGLCPSGYALGGFWGSCTIAKSSPHMTDGDGWMTNNGWLRSGGDATTKFYVMSYQLTGDVEGFSFAIDRADCGRGGLKLCEAILFTGATNTTARAEAIHRHLLKKWKAVGSQEPYAFSCDVAAGATLKLANTDTNILFAASRIAGGGTLDAGDVAGVSEIAATATNAMAMTCLTVLGKVVFADSVTVRLKDGGVRMRRTTVPILTASALENVDLANWTVANELTGNRTVILTSDATTVYARIVPPGVSLLLR